MQHQALQQRGLGPSPAHNPVDQGACGPGAMAGYPGAYPYGPAHSYTAGLFSPTQVNPPGGIFVVPVYVGFTGMLDETGTFYSIDATGLDAGGAPIVSLTSLGTDLEIQVDVGYVQFFGAKLHCTDGILTAFSNSNSLDRVLGEVSVNVWDTDGCFCQWDDCASATSDSPIVLRGKVLPDCDEQPISCDVEGTSETHFFRRFEVNLMGTHFRTVEGCTAVGAFAPLNVASGGPVAPMATGPCVPGLTAPYGMAPGAQGLPAGMNGYNGQ